MTRIRLTKIIYCLITIINLIFLIIQIKDSKLLYTSLCLITQLLITIPSIIEKKYKLVLSNIFKIFIIIMIFACTILGEINHFYIKYSHYDTIIHLLYGFLCAGIGFLIANLLNQNNKKNAQIYYLLISFTFSIATGVSWELCEYGVDKIFLMDTQKDTNINEISSLKMNDGKYKPKIIKDIEYTIIYNKDLFGNIQETRINGYLDIGINDTMKDLLSMRLGAFIFTTCAYLYLKEKRQFRFIEIFIAKKSINRNC